MTYLSASFHNNGHGSYHLRPIFKDRREAGKQLAKSLKAYAGNTKLLILGLPRGGVVVAFEVAHVLKAPLDVFVVRKLGVPGYEELAMGAIASGGICIIRREITQSLQLEMSQIENVIEREKKELIRRESLYRGNLPPLHIRGRVVILVDDGLATGSTMSAAVLALRQRKPARIVVAVPIASKEACAELTEQVDETICLNTPEPFHGVGLWYEDFSQTSDQEVQDLLWQSVEEQISQGG